MDDTATTGHAAESGGHGDGHGEIHLPPNSWCPIVLTIALTATFVGFIVGPWLWILGSLGTAATLVAWYLAARNEFRELPDEL